ncbi:MAG: type II toxin-antitoxin system VapC family toxin [Myxococcota bacterium]
MIVVDTNVIAYLYLAGEHTQRAEALLEADPEWVAPILWKSEFRNILAGYFRRGALSLEQARAIQNEAESLLSGGEHEVESDRVFELVRRSECTAYDCEFVALAMHLQRKLVTLDKALLRSFPGDTMSLRAF